MTPYDIVLLIAGILLTAISNARLSYHLCTKKWNMDDGNGLFVIIVSSIAAVCVSGVIGYGAINRGGTPFGVAYLVASIPMVGVGWAYVVGSIKAMELALYGLSKKLD